MFASVSHFLGGLIGGQAPREPDSAREDREDDKDSLTDTDNEDTASDDKDTASEGLPASRFLPTVEDVIVVKAMFLKGKQLPIEMVDLVLDHAEYWPHTTAFVKPQPGAGGSLSVYGGRRDNENRFLVRTVPLGFTKDPHPHMGQYRSTPVRPLPLAAEHPLQAWQAWIGSADAITSRPARKIVFTLRSHDQGWGGNYADHGTYHGSWTWFDVGLERFDAEAGPCDEKCPDTNQEETSGSSSASGDYPPLKVCALRPIRPTLAPRHPNDAAGDAAEQALHFGTLPDDMMVQCNVVAESDTKEHVVEWRWTDAVDRGSPRALERRASEGRGEATGDGAFVRALKPGDVVTVWAKSRFPGWVNHVESVKVDVFWAI